MPLPIAFASSTFSAKVSPSVLRVTPAMAADVTDKLWEVADIVALIEAKEIEKPTVRGPYKKRAGISN